MDSDSSLSELSSDLSSIRSITPPIDCPPSPTLTQDTETGDVPPSSKNTKRGSDTEDQPPAKKRKRPEPKPRKTDTLDFSKDLVNLAQDQKDGLHKLLQVLRKRRKIVVIAGAGISVSAGIPDFRSSTGLFKTLKGEHKLKASGKQLFDASVYQTDSSTTTFHDMVRQLHEQVTNAQPTEFHEMLDTLGLEDRLLRLYTQNVDGIDTKLPFLGTEVPLNRKGPWPRTIQVHGGLEYMACSKCNAIFGFESELFNGPDPPPCTKCVEADRIRTDQAGKRSHGVGRLRPRMALYNERAPDEDAIGAVMAADLRARPDALIVVGTSLKIPGVRRLVREMCGVIRDRRDGLTIWMNMDPPPLGRDFEDCWDLVVKGACDQVADQWKNSHTKDQSGSDTEKEKEKDKEKETEKGKDNDGESKPKKRKYTKKVSLPSPSMSPSGSDTENKVVGDLPTPKKKAKVVLKMENNGAKEKPKKPRKPRALKKSEKPVGVKDLASTFKVSKPGIPSMRLKKTTPKKEPVSSPLSSPRLPSSYLPSPRTPSKSASKPIPYFPGLEKHTPQKYRTTFIQQRNTYRAPLSSPAGRSFRSSPPPHEPISSPVFGGRELVSPRKSIGIPARRPTHILSRPGSSSSQDTVSPTSIPRGMKDLID